MAPEPLVIVDEDAEYYIFEDLTVDLLADFLISIHVPLNAVAALKSEEVNGRSFLSLTESDLREMNIKLGPRKMLMEIIRSTPRSQEIILSNSRSQEVMLSNLRSQKIIESYSISQEVILSNSRSHEVMLSDSRSQEVILSNSRSHEVMLSNSRPQQQRIRLKANNPGNTSRPDNRGDEIPDVGIQDHSSTISKTLKKHPQGQYLLNTLNAQTCLTPTERKLFIRIIVENLISTHGHYPSSSLKTQLAKQIVSEFPCLKSTRTVGGYEHFYNPASQSGFIEYRLKTVRVKLPPTQKRYRSRFVTKTTTVEPVILLSDEELKQKISLMTLTTPTPENVAIIVHALQETYVNRRDSIMVQKMFPGQILKEYPRLKDYEGEMIDLEFQLSHGENDNFFTRFPELSRKILAYCSKNKLDLMVETAHLEDEYLTSLVLLTELLPNRICRRKLNSDETLSKQVPMKELLTIKPLGSSLDEDDADPQQPYLVALGPNYFLKIDGEEIYVGSNILKAFDLLFKCHFAFHVKYNRKLSCFYSFVSNFIYEIDEAAPTPSAEMLNVTLNSVF